MKLRRLFNILLLGGTLCVGPLAVASTPSIETRIEPDSIGIGDHFTYSITVTQDLMQVIGFPVFETQKGDKLELVEDVKVDTIEQDGRHLKLRKSYVLRSFDEGRYNLGKAKVLYLDKNITDTLYSADSVLFMVNTFVIDSTSQSIYDLKAQRDLPFKFAEISDYVKWGGLFVLLLLAIILLAMRIMAKQGKKLTDIFKPTPPPPPHVEAIMALEALNNQKLWQNSKYKEYYSTLTNILRHYISRRYDIAAMEMTSEEIIKAVKTIDLPTKSSMDLISLLKDADLVKFAKATPDGEDNEASYFKAYYFVEETKEQDPTQASEEELLDTSGAKGEI